MAVRQPTLPHLPGGSPLGSYVYVLRFSGEAARRTIKVGVTCNPRSRIRTYRSHLTPFGITIGKRWVSEPHEFAAGNEAKLINFCRERGVRVNGSEYFTGVTFDEVVSFARTLTYFPLPISVHPPAQTVNPHGALVAYYRVADAIEEEIRSGRLPRGARLPNERDLGVEHGVAAGTARRAVKELRDRGLVTTLANKGTFVLGAD